MKLINTNKMLLIACNELAGFVARSIHLCQLQFVQASQGGKVRASVLVSRAVGKMLSESQTAAYYRPSCSKAPTQRLAQRTPCFTLRVIPG
jgi:hypothetical protein